MHVCARAKSLQPCPALCDPMDCSPPGSSVHGILQARILEWVAMPSSRGSSRPRDRTRVSCIAGGFFTADTREAPGALTLHGEILPVLPNPKASPSCQLMLQILPLRRQPSPLDPSF